MRRRERNLFSVLILGRDPVGTMSSGQPCPSSRKLVSGVGLNRRQKRCTNKQPGQGVVLSIVDLSSSLTQGGLERLQKCVKYLPGGQVPPRVGTGHSACVPQIWDFWEILTLCCLAVFSEMKIFCLGGKLLKHRMLKER